MDKKLKKKKIVYMRMNEIQYAKLAAAAVEAKTTIVKFIFKKIGIDY